jgi:hypothetical protein
MQLLCVSGVFIFMKYKNILFPLFLLQIQSFIIELCLCLYIVTCWVFDVTNNS